MNLQKNTLIKTKKPFCLNSIFLGLTRINIKETEVVSLDICQKWIKSKCCGEILNFDICILKTDTNARFF